MLASSRPRSSGSRRRASRGFRPAARERVRLLCAYTCLAIRSACCNTPSTVRRVNWEKCTRVVVATTRKVSAVMTRVSFALRPMRILHAVPVELVVQGLEADLQDLGRPGFVVADGRQGLEDEGLLRFLDGGSQRQRDLRGGRVPPFRGEARGEMSGGDEIRLAGDDGPLE